MNATFPHRISTCFSITSGVTGVFLCYLLKERFDDTRVKNEHQQQFIPVNQLLLLAVADARNLI